MLGDARGIVEQEVERWQGKIAAHGEYDHLDAQARHAVDVELAVCEVLERLLDRIDAAADEEIDRMYAEHMRRAARRKLRLVAPGEGI